LRGPSGRDLTCSAYRVATGIELRAEYGPNDIVSTKLCRDDDADEQIATTADAWRFTHCEELSRDREGVGGRLQRHVYGSLNL
jgi:hypothetical protein